MFTLRLETLEKQGRVNELVMTRVKECTTCSSGIILFVWSGFRKRCWTW